MTTYSFGLHTLHLGEVTRGLRNPATGESVIAPQDLGLDENERSAFTRLLAHASAVGPDQFGFYLISFSEPRASIRVGCRELLSETEPCCAIIVESDGEFHSAAINFVFELARQCNMAFRSSTNPQVVALPPTPLSSNCSERWPHAAILLTALDLSQWLENELKLPVQATE